MENPQASKSSKNRYGTLPESPSGGLLGGSASSPQGNVTGSPQDREKAPVEFYATCSRGLERLLAGELHALGAKRVRPLTGGVAFFGTLETGYRALLWLRTASRVLLILERVPAANAEELYAGIYALPWEEHLPPTGTLAVDARGTNEALLDTRFLALKVKDAVCDRFLKQGGVRPSVNREQPTVRINVTLRGQRLTVALDLAGTPLHQRGYRSPSPAIVAPLRETLAAAMVLLALERAGLTKPGANLGARGGAKGGAGLSAKGDARRDAGWDAGWGAGLDARRDAGWGAQPNDLSALPKIWDPLCGSGTLAIEAAWLLAEVAPGLKRTQWGFSAWLQHKPSLWAAVYQEAERRAAEGTQRLQELAEPLLHASDLDPRAVEVAKESARRAGVAECIKFSCADVASLVVPENLAAPEDVATPCNVQPNSGQPDNSNRASLLVSNPPYGERLGTASQLPVIYAALAALSQRRTTVLISPDASLAEWLGRTPCERIDTFNGPLETTLSCWDPLEPDALETSTAPSSEFANRLRKMAAHRGKWARRAAISCYRIYDADLPNYAVAIDLYQGAAGTPSEGQRWLHLAEYRAPADIDPTKAHTRLAQILREAPPVLGVPSTHVFLKERRRARGGEQYQKPQSGAAGLRGAGLRGAEATPHLIEEQGLLFEVEFAEHLDTGIFLDHRPMRTLLRERAQGKNCLNLFAYTGTASVAMAAGGATSVTSIDLSKTYTAWAKRNLERNGFSSKQCPCIQSDVLQWVALHANKGDGANESRSPKTQPPESRSTAKVAPHANRGDGGKATAPCFDLIFCDPPTFSNSARMKTQSWDVQRNHTELLGQLGTLLAPDGLILFSCNLRSFTLDYPALAQAGLQAQDITKASIPPDFERNQRVHHSFLLSLAS